jgi:hypothetical protein
MIQNGQLPLAILVAFLAGFCVDLKFFLSNACTEGVFWLVLIVGTRILIFLL